MHTNNVCKKKMHADAILLMFPQVNHWEMRVGNCYVYGIYV